MRVQALEWAYQHTSQNTIDSQQMVGIYDMIV